MAPHHRDPTEPLFHWYVDSAVGKELVIALYTRPCRYNQCTFCILPSMAAGGTDVTVEDIQRQVDRVLGSYTADQLNDVAKVSIYTAASTLDPKCLPTECLVYLLLKVADFPKLRGVSFETRPEFVEEWKLRTFQAVLGPSVGLEISIGYETFNDHLRNVVLKKGLSDRALHKLMEKLAANDCSLKAYVLLKPHHTLSEEEGVVEAQNGVEHLADMGAGYGVPVSIHLNPTYMAEDSNLTVEMRAAGFQPPEASSIIEVARTARERGLDLYIGLDDEGLAVEGGVFRTTGYDRQTAIDALIAYNQHQDLDRLVLEVSRAS